MRDLENVVASMAEAAKIAGVKVIAGDTKVVPKDKGGDIYINTTGVGTFPSEGDGVSSSDGRNGDLHDALSLNERAIAPGDVMISSGNLGEHGMAILAERFQVFEENKLLSDCAPIFPLVQTAIESGTTGIKAFRDPTRGGLVGAVKELITPVKKHEKNITSENCNANQKVNMENNEGEKPGMKCILKEEAIPLSAEMKEVSELLGIDPLYLASEGRVICVVSSTVADRVLGAWKQRHDGVNAAIIGEIISASTEENGTVLLETGIGGTRKLENHSGEPLPRIC